MLLESSCSHSQHLRAGKLYLLQYQQMTRNRDVLEPRVREPELPHVLVGRGPGGYNKGALISCGYCLPLLSGQLTGLTCRPPPPPVPVKPQGGRSPSRSEAQPVLVCLTPVSQHSHSLPLSLFLVQFVPSSPTTPSLGPALVGRGPEQILVHTTPSGPLPGLFFPEKEHISKGESRPSVSHTGSG